MRNLAALIAGLTFSIVAIAQRINIPSQDSGNHRTLCTEDWTNRGVLDQSMFNHCMRKEAEGYRDLVFLADKYKSMRWIEAAIDYSIKEWSKRGNRRDRMVHFELKSITEGYEDLVYMAKQPGWNKEKYDVCSLKWGIRFDMIVSCYKD